MTSKVCMKCEERKPIDKFYSYSKTNKNGEEYTYYRPDCKECSKKSSVEWRENNYNRWYHEKRKAYNARPDRIYKDREASRRKRESGYQLEWQRKNKEKIKLYQSKRSNKSHEISNFEWGYCTGYFNNSCAYCGISESEAIDRYGNRLHRDHVDPNGENDITNCVPACKPCNSSKNDKLLADWYNNNNSIYSQGRHDEILKWMNYIKPKKTEWDIWDKIIEEDE